MKKTVRQMYYKGPNWNAQLAPRRKIFMFKRQCVP